MSPTETNFAVRIWRICQLNWPTHCLSFSIRDGDVVAVPEGGIGMSKLLKSLMAGTLGLTLALASPALGRGGGGGGFGGGGGGGHGGFGGGGFGGGGMHGGFGGMGGGMHGGFGGGGMHFGGGGMRFGGMGGARFAHAAFMPRAGFGFQGARGFHHRFVHDRFFRHRFNRFAFFGAPFVYAGYYDGCWQRVWTPYGWSWANACGDYLY
jgi:hypothetical protein